MFFLSKVYVRYFQMKVSLWFVRQCSVMVPQKAKACFSSRTFLRHNVKYRKQLFVSLKDVFYVQ